MTAIGEAGDAPYDRLGPERATTPLVVAVPHAGRFYPAAIARDRAVGWSVLEQLEDRQADRLIHRLIADEAVCIVARVARAWIDLNRAETDIAGAPAGESARAQAGLGLVPSRLGGRPLWRVSPSATEIAARIAAVHRPYHAAVAHALDEARAAHGYAILIDCHSMPPIARHGRPARIVVGDRHGASAAPAVSHAAMMSAGAAGLPAARNTPYAGAYTLDRHGDPAGHVHALQIEIDRSLYLARGSGEPLADGVAISGAVLASMAWSAVAAAGECSNAIAAE